MSDPHKHPHPPHRHHGWTTINTPPRAPATTSRTPPTHPPPPPSRTPQYPSPHRHTTTAPATSRTATPPHRPNIPSTPAAPPSTPRHRTIPTPSTGLSSPTLSRYDLRPSPAESQNPHPYSTPDISFPKLVMKRELMRDLGTPDQRRGGWCGKCGKWAVRAGRCGVCGAGSVVEKGPGKEEGRRK